MKKILAIFLALLACALFLTACDETHSIEETTTSSNIATNDSTTITLPESSENTLEGTEEPGSTTEPEESENNPEQIYNKALDFIDQKNYSDAYELLSKINNYEPAAEKLKNFFYAPQIVIETWTTEENEAHCSILTYVYDESGNVSEHTVGDETYTYSYDDVGNILTGYDLVYHELRSYNYQNGKLYQVITYNSTTTYSYNENGQISQEICDYGNGIDEYIYQYENYASGILKTLKIHSTENDYDSEYHYDESGNLSQIVTTDYSLIYTYGEHGVTQANWQTTEEGESAIFSYTYDERGALVKLEAKVFYEDGLFIEEYFFTNHLLCYSENRDTRNRIAIINYIDEEALVDIPW